jgi:hypothetical protein
MWVCLAKVALLDPKKMNIGFKTMDCVFIRYTYKSSVYWFRTQVNH